MQCSTSTLQGHHLRAREQEGSWLYVLFQVPRCVAEQRSSSDHELRLLWSGMTQGHCGKQTMYQGDSQHLKYPAQLLVKWIPVSNTLWIASWKHTWAIHRLSSCSRLTLFRCAGLHLSSWRRGHITTCYSAHTALRPLLNSRPIKSVLKFSSNSDRGKLNYIQKRLRIQEIQLPILPILNIWNKSPCLFGAEKSVHSLRTQLGYLAPSLGNRS